MHSSRFLIYETYLDSFGHMNHAKYLELFEQARWDWMAASGMGTHTILETGIAPVVLNVNVSYRKELLPRQEVTVHCQLASVQNKTLTIEQEMRLPDGTVACSLTLLAGIMDTRARKLITPPADWLKAFGPAAGAEAVADT